MASAAAKIDVRVKQLPHGEGLDLPNYQTADSAGCDLLADCNAPVDFPSAVVEGTSV